nr:MAG TPA: hypothetical protein [Caudoviricetes sp.]
MDKIVSVFLNSLKIVRKNLFYKLLKNNKLQKKLKKL